MRIKEIIPLVSVAQRKSSFFEKDLNFVVLSERRFCNACVRLLFDSWEGYFLLDNSNILPHNLPQIRISFLGSLGWS